MRINLPRWRINRDIRSSHVRLIDPMGIQLGVKPVEVAFKIAQEHGLDLIEVAPQASPPVCKILDFDKFKYEQIRKWKDTHKRQKAGGLKEVRFTPTVHDHDLETKIKRIEEFLDEHDKVRVTIFFRGREIIHQEFGHKILNTVRERLKDKAKVEKEPFLEHKRLFMVLSPAK